jgi:diadenosine tetraphosphate (Ap4A) HIT family hydrolase
MAWWPRDKWVEMRSGTDCPMCADAHLPSNPASDLITKLSTSYARLARNQTAAGYCVVILNRHAAELHELEAGELAGFWSDVARVGAAIHAEFSPVKLDYLVMGHRAPHIHCHVYPQYEDDDPFLNVDISRGESILGGAEQEDRLRALRNRLRPD